MSLENSRPIWKFPEIQSREHAGTVLRDATTVFYLLGALYIVSSISLAGLFNFGILYLIFAYILDKTKSRIASILLGIIQYAAFVIVIAGANWDNPSLKTFGAVGWNGYFAWWATVAILSTFKFNNPALQNVSTLSSEKPAGIASLRDELEKFWNALPNKALFAALLGSWAILFVSYGNITLGYVKTDSLFGWMHYVFDTSPDDEHGSFIPLVVLLLFWWKRRQLMGIEKRIWWPALVVLVAGIVFHLLGYRVQQTRISIVGFFLGLYGLMGLVWGREFLKRSFFPMFLFAFCVPLGTEAERITFPLRLFATKITESVASGILSIEVIRDGTQLFEPSGKYKYEVAAACSGIRSLSAIFAFATIYGFMSLQESWKRLLMILSAFPLAVISNVIRLIGIILAAELFGQDAGNYVHESWWISLLPYVPGIFGVLFLGRVLRGSEEKQSVVAPQSQPA